MADTGAAAPPSGIHPKISGRVIRVVSRTLQAAVTNTVVVQLDAQGGENALGFDLNFNAAQLQYVSASLGADATGGILNINASQAVTGKLGFALALSPGVSFPAGTREVLKVNFAVAPAATGSAGVTFGTGPVVAETADVSAAVQAASYNDGILAISPFPPVLQVGLTGGVVTLTWPTVASNFTLQAHPGGGLAPTGWSNLVANPIVNGEAKMLTITNAADSQLFRLYKP